MLTEGPNMSNATL